MIKKEVRKLLKTIFIFRLYPVNNQPAPPIPHQAAFTLIELIVVLFIISLTAALVMPNLWESKEGALKSEAKRISNTLRYINDEASGKKQLYRLNINLSDDSWGFESESESRSFQMKEDIMFKDVYVPSLGEVSIGEVVLQFGPTGAEEPILVHLTKDGLEYTVSFNHISGRAKISKGYLL